MTLNYNEALTHPLSTDALIQERVTALVGRACRRQLWFLFLDADDIQLPTIIPFADHPTLPDAFTPTVARIIEEAVETENASCVILVIERFADSIFTDADKQWARAVSDELDLLDVPLRCILLSHRDGIRWFAKDDYRFGSIGS